MIGGKAGEERSPGIRPRQTLWRRLDAAARAAFPSAVIALLILLLSTPLNIPGQAEIMPAAVLGAVFFWTIFRPAAMYPPVIFLLGLFSDLLGDFPLGTQVLALLAAYGLTLRWRRVLVKQNLMVVWLSFCAVAVGGALLEWCLTCLVAFVVLPVGPAIFQAVLGAAMYPLLAVPFARAHRSIAAPEHA